MPWAVHASVHCLATFVLAASNVKLEFAVIILLMVAVKRTNEHLFERVILFFHVEFCSIKGCRKDLVYYFNSL